MCYNLSWSDKKVIKSFKEHSKKECIYCGKKLVEDNDTTVDHLNPISRGGRTHKNNLGLCCKECNTEKSDMTYEEYIEYLEVKHYLLRKNTAWNELNLTITSFNNIIKTYNDAFKLVPRLKQEKTDIEAEIRDLDKVSASDGYMLFKSLRDILKELDEAEDIVRTSKSANLLANENIKKLQEEKLKLKNKIMGQVRNECHIGSLASLNINYVDFSKWKQTKPLYKAI